MPNDALAATADMVGVDVGQRFGRLVSAGSHKLHLHCTGKGLPVVILEAGIGGNHLDWIRAQPDIAKFTTVCSYDRAGYGWSEPAAKPRTVSRIAQELRSLLQSAGLETPVILVGHSFGGLTSLYFASRYPDLVAGLVLVDSMHPDQYERFAQQGIDVPAQPSRAVIVSARPIVTHGIPSEHKDLAYALAINDQARSYMLNELRNVLTSIEELRGLDAPSTRVAVLAHGRREWDRVHQDGRMEDLWLRLQLDFAERLDADSLVVAPRSGHQIPLEDPALIVRAVRRLADTIRAEQPARR